ncbi:MAG: histidine--tRNA ligase [Actinomyces succiniciruminis]|uniref:Histidine--tRNA ligase n=1 Tax=Actinomyces succiniciruminis TaxID=1522002 RepID=A0A1L7RJW8_9ACTO|nr:histidine--tRNA ligase [Actinomyces succiniciruminis]MBE6475241.1 histidine--tRNA ligase [Actinomyces succiniciruminis]CED92276.1 Histidine--tRNA ligase [Actinomyces succiniciruminis]
MQPMTAAQVRQAQSSLSGFPEWLPAARIVETQFIDTLRRTFELHGFSGIETRAVEPLSELTRKGETSKEVYLLSRLQADPGEAEETDPAKQLGLHFDLTVPFARYVLDNAGTLHFPFKRYQIQKVWRGERPQEGRFREFVQADIDVVGDGALPLYHDVEMPLIMHEALSALPIPAVTIHVSNRKVAQGFYQSVGVGEDQLAEVLRVVDKLDKIGAGRVATELVDVVGITPEQADAALRLAEITGADAERVRADVLAALNGAAPSELLVQGLDELSELLRSAARRRPGAIVADLKIARGLDYYTGTVYESFMAGHEDLGSVCSGGRYDSLASDGKRTFPGVGISIGLSRLLARVIGAGMLEVTRAVPTAVLVAVTDEEHRGVSDSVADALRSRGIAADVSPTAAKYGKQIRFADKRGIPYVWFPGAEGEPDSVKDIRSGEQVPADAATWFPADEADLAPRLRPVGAAAGQAGEQG